MNYEVKKEIEISIYDYDNDLIDRFTVETVKDKEDILSKSYYGNLDARYYDLKITEEHNYCYFKS